MSGLPYEQSAYTPLNWMIVYFTYYTIETYASEYFNYPFLFKSKEIQ